MNQPIGACDLLRGVGRALAEAGQTVLAELPLRRLAAALARLAGRLELPYRA
jgi:hypothetical protein